LSPQRILRAADTQAGHRIVAVLVLLSIFAVSYLMWRQQDQTDCTAEYNQRSAASAQARAEAADVERKALVAMVRAVVEEPRGDERAALERYLETTAETDKQRRENPVPPPPADLCR
jgi:hypothetical protein